MVAKLARCRLVLSVLSCLLVAAAAAAEPSAGNRLTYLDGPVDLYYPHRKFPKLVTPQWVGEEGVEAVVVIAIDDMRDVQRYEAFLRPILERLKKIDGRAPVSIMTNSIDPQGPQLQAWLKEGMSLETHSFDHPCPFFAGGDFAKAKRTYDKCVDLMFKVPNSRPVAFRVPCCDSMNTPTPRFFAEIFNKTTPDGHFLTIDSSVFNITTANDPDLPRDLVLEPDGRERFRKYIPADKSFVNTIEDYPYPYVIGGLCWEFPCVLPSDWDAQYLHKPNNPKTLEDWKAQLDATVIKQGVFTMVFHPHGWIKAEQVVELIDHAVAKHGKKVKFLTFKECQERLDKNLLAGQPIRDAKGRDNGVRLLDVDNDGYIDVVIGNDKLKQTRLWSPKERKWAGGEFPDPLVLPDAQGVIGDGGVRWGVFRADGKASYYVRSGPGKPQTLGEFDGKTWVRSELQVPCGALMSRTAEGNDTGLRLRDIDGDGRCEIIGGTVPYVFVISADHKWSTNIELPKGTRIVDKDGHDAGARFVDIDEDGRDDVVFSNEKQYALYLFKDMKEGWTKKALSGKQPPYPPSTQPTTQPANPAGTGGSPVQPPTIPPIVVNGTDNGMWAHSRHLWWQNEYTDKLPNVVDRRSFNALLAHIDPEPKSPEASLKAIQVRPGFQVELAAAEPLTMDPVAISFGADGKLWVVEMADYPLGEDGKGKPAGRVRYLEDTDGDGRYDKSTLFLDKLPFPNGVLPWRKGVLITCAPDIFYAEDTDGDGLADKREVLFTGFSPGNQQHRANGLYYGLDNWIYGANGDSGGKVRSLNTNQVVSISGRDFRLKPDTGEFEGETGQTQFGRTQDDAGNQFGCNNPNPMYHFVIADHYLRRNPRLGAPRPVVNVPRGQGLNRVYPISRTQPRFNDYFALNHFTSANSVTIYRDDLFGPTFVNNAFVSEPVHNLVSRILYAPDGVTFTGTRAPGEETTEFFASADNWTRPTTIRVGPDGCLYIADMYRHVIEHPEWIPQDWQEKLDLRAGHDKGRIYRISPVGVPRRPIPRLDKLDAPGLVAALDSPSGWQRDMAQHLLVERQDKDAIAPLKKLAAEGQRPLARMHALCALDGLGALDAELLTRALDDAHPFVRRQAARLSEPLLDKSPEIGTALAKLSADGDAQVRLQAALSLGYWHDDRAADALARIALTDAQDRFIPTAVFSSLTDNNLPAFVRAVAARAGQGGIPPALADTLFQLGGASGEPRVLAALLKSLTPSEGAQYSAWQFAALARLYDAMESGDTNLPRLAEHDADLKAAMANAGRLDDASRTLAADASKPAALRASALRLLNRSPDRRADDTKLLASLLLPRNDPDVQAAAVAALARRGDANTPAVLLGDWKKLAPALRGQILDALIARGEWLSALLDAVEKGKISPGDFDAPRRQRLLDHRSFTVRSRAAKVFADVISPDRQKVIDAFRPALTLTGDATRGREVFAKTCVSCHQIGDLGNNIGPDLASMGDKSPESLLTAILDPNRAVEAKFANYAIDTRDGQTLSGIITGETGNSVTLQAPASEPVIILRSDIKSLHSTGASLMPEGLESGYQPQDLADLIAFVRGASPATSKRKSFEGNTPATVSPGEGGLVRLLSSNCEIYGSSLVLEKQYGNLGYWSSEDDQAIWTVKGIKPGRYDVWIDHACDPAAAGNTLLLEAGTAHLTAKVNSTGNWDTYTKSYFGTITLTAAEFRVTVRSAGKIEGALIDIKSVELVPSRR